MKPKIHGRIVRSILKDYTGKNKGRGGYYSATPK